MNLIPSTTELSPAPAPKGAASKGAASCSGLHQVAKIFKDWNTTTPGTLYYVWPISIPCLSSFHCTPLTWTQPFLLHNPHQEEGDQTLHLASSRDLTSSPPTPSPRAPQLYQQHSLTGHFRPRTCLFRHHLASTEQRTIVLLYLSAVLLLMQPSPHNCTAQALLTPVQGLFCRQPVCPCQLTHSTDGFRGKDHAEPHTLQQSQQPPKACRTEISSLTLETSLNHRQWRQNWKVNGMNLWVGAWEQVPVSLRQLGKGCCRTGLAATTALGDVGKMTQAQGALRCSQGALLLMLGRPVVPPRRQPIPNDSKAFQDYRTAKADNRVWLFFSAHSSSYFTMPVPKANLTSIPNPAVWSSPLLSVLCSIQTAQLSVTAGE